MKKPSKKLISKMLKIIYRRVKTKGLGMIDSFAEIVNVVVNKKAWDEL